MAQIAYWQQINKKAEELNAAGPFHWITYISQDGGTDGPTMQAETAIAAECIVKKSHRLATQAEVKREKEREEKSRAAYLAAEKAKMQRFVIETGAASAAGIPFENQIAAVIGAPAPKPTETNTAETKSQA